MEEHARHGVCLSQVVGDEPGGSLGAGLGQQWGIGAARLHLFKDDVVLQALACDTDTGWKKSVLRSGDFFPQMIVVTVFQDLCYASYINTYCNIFNTYTVMCTPQS